MSVLGRVLEEKGLTTTGIVLIEEHAQKVKPPRMLSVPFNFGNTLGKPNNPELQHDVLKDAFALLNEPVGPVLKRYQTNLKPEMIIQGSQASSSVSRTDMDPIDEIKILGPEYEKWLADNNGRTGVGLSTVPWTDFGNIIVFLKRYIDDESSDIAERPDDFSIPHFVRYCVDDLKTFYFEAKMGDKPDSEINELHTWFWSETALAEFLNRLAKKMRSSENKETKAISRGIAR